MCVRYQKEKPNHGSFSRNSRLWDIGFVLIIIAGFFIGAEWLMRIVGLGDDWDELLSFQQHIQDTYKKNGPIMSDDYLFWKLRPNTQFPPCVDPANDDGYRNPPVERRKPPGTFRFVSLGDSCTHAAHVSQENTYVRVAERLLRERCPEIRIEGINAGVPGYSSLQVYRSLERDLSGFEPDLVTVYCGWNDLEVNGYLPDAKQTVLRIRAQSIRRVFWKSRLYTVMKMLLLKPFTQGHRVAPEEFQQNLASLTRLCRERGISLIYFSLPQLYAEERQHNNIIRTHAKDSNVRLLELASSIPEPHKQYFDNDGIHPNAEGHSLIGAMLADAVCSAAPRLDCAACTTTRSEIMPGSKSGISSPGP